MRVVMTRDVNDHRKGDVVELPLEHAARWLEAGLARMEGSPEPEPGLVRLEGSPEPEPRPPVTAEPGVEVLNPMPAKVASGMDRMQRRAVRK